MCFTTSKSLPSLCFCLGWFEEVVWCMQQDTKFCFQLITLLSRLWLMLLFALLSVQLSTPLVGTLPAFPVSSPSNTTEAGITGASRMQIPLDYPGVQPHQILTKTERGDTV